ncbi:three prime repair exonuclease 2-like isoform X1 [Helicoverpa zea]|uniref:three prime repair exonuclease 2-like isoform X1 n=1 Tax=Helicoverpa zea TaxID=7113 RepID=UPI001F560008|nr:three prime repair exonuclease 2-like isoform X1 [Helicoverpa zea]
MGKIATYVFLDAVTNKETAQYKGELKIAELCMIAVKRKHIELRQEEPRTQNKFKMCFWVYYIHDDDYSRRTGLSSINMRNETNFNNDAFNAINSFLSCLEKPVCMIAHDGFKVHFPVLKYHFHNLKVSLPNDYLCTDSIYAFYDIMEPETKGGTKSSRSRHNKPGVKLHKNMVRETFYDEEPKESYKLCDIFSRVIKGDLTPYNAENHCQMIMKLAIEKNDAFVAWVERNHCRFSGVP